MRIFKRNYYIHFPSEEIFLIKDKGIEWDLHGKGFLKITRLALFAFEVYSLLRFTFKGRK